MDCEGIGDKNSHSSSYILRDSQANSASTNGAAYEVNCTGLNNFVTNGIFSEDNSVFSPKNINDSTSELPLTDKATKDDNSSALDKETKDNYRDVHSKLNCIELGSPRILNNSTKTCGISSGKQSKTDVLTLKSTPSFSGHGKQLENPYRNSRLGGKEIDYVALNKITNRNPVNNLNGLSSRIAKTLKNLLSKQNDKKLAERKFFKRTSELDESNASSNTDSQTNIVAAKVLKIIKKPNLAEIKPSKSEIEESNASSSDADLLTNIDVSKVLKIVTKPNLVEIKPSKRLSKPHLKTYCNRRKNFQKNNVVESFALPDDPIIPERPLVTLDDDPLTVNTSSSNDISIKCSEDLWRPQEFCTKRINFSDDIRIKDYQEPSCFNDSFDNDERITTLFCDDDSRAKTANDCATIIDDLVHKNNASKQNKNNYVCSTKNNVEKTKNTAIIVINDIINSKINNNIVTKRSRQQKGGKSSDSQTTNIVSGNSDIASCISPSETVGNRCDNQFKLVDSIAEVKTRRELVKTNNNSTILDQSNVSIMVKCNKTTDVTSMDKNIEESKQKNPGCIESKSKVTSTSMGDEDHSQTPAKQSSTIKNVSDELENEVETSQSPGTSSPRHSLRIRNSKSLIDIQKSISSTDHTPTKLIHAQDVTEKLAEQTREQTRLCHFQSKSESSISPEKSQHTDLETKNKSSSVINSLNIEIKTSKNDHVQSKIPNIKSPAKINSCDPEIKIIIQKSDKDIVDSKLKNINTSSASVYSCSNDNTKVSDVCSKDKEDVCAVKNIPSNSHPVVKSKDQSEIPAVPCKSISNTTNEHLNALSPLRETVSSTETVDRSTCEEVDENIDNLSLTVRLNAHASNKINTNDVDDLPLASRLEMSKSEVDKLNNSEINQDYDKKVDRLRFIETDKDDVPLSIRLSARKADRNGNKIERIEPFNAKAENEKDVITKRKNRRSRLHRSKSESDTIIFEKINLDIETPKSRLRKLQSDLTPSTSDEGTSQSIIKKTHNKLKKAEVFQVKPSSNTQNVDSASDCKSLTRTVSPEKPENDYTSSENTTADKPPPMSKATEVANWFKNKLYENEYQENRRSLRLFINSTMFEDVYKNEVDGEEANVNVSQSRSKSPRKSFNRHKDVNAEELSEGRKPRSKSPRKTINRHEDVDKEELSEGRKPRSKSPRKTFNRHEDVDKEELSEGRKLRSESPRKTINRHKDVDQGELSKGRKPRSKSPRKTFNRRKDVDAEESSIGEVVPEEAIPGPAGKVQKIQQRDKKNKEEPPVAVQFCIGDLVWVKFGSFPYWPSMITASPETNDHKQEKVQFNKKRVIYHVTFFGDKGRRAWIKAEHLVLFQREDDVQTIPELKAEMRFKNSRVRFNWKTGVQEASSLTKKPIQARLKFFSEIYGSKEPTVRRSRSVVRDNFTTKRKRTQSLPVIKNNEFEGEVTKKGVEETLPLLKRQKTSLEGQKFHSESNSLSVGKPKLGRPRKTTDPNADIHAPDKPKLGRPKKSVDNVDSPLPDKPKLGRPKKSVDNVDTPLPDKPKLGRPKKSVDNVDTPLPDKPKLGRPRKSADDVDTPLPDKPKLGRPKKSVDNVDTPLPDKPKLGRPKKSADDVDSPSPDESKLGRLKKPTELDVNTPIAKPKLDKLRKSTNVNIEDNIEKVASKKTINSIEGKSPQKLRLRQLRANLPEQIKDPAESIPERSRRKESLKSKSPEKPKRVPSPIKKHASADKIVDRNLACEEAEKGSSDVRHSSRIAQNKLKQTQLAENYVSDTDSKVSENSSVPTSLESQAALYRRNNIFRGVPKEKVCQICQKPDDIVRCKGKCNGLFHVGCVEKLFKKQLDSIENEKFKNGLDLLDEEIEKMGTEENEMEKDDVNGRITPTVEIVSIQSKLNNELPNLSASMSPNFKKLSLSEKIDYKMKEIMMANELYHYSESADSSLEEINHKDLSDDKEIKSPHINTESKKSMKKKTKIIKHVTADDISFITLDSESSFSSKKSYKPSKNSSFIGDDAVITKTEKKIDEAKDYKCEFCTANTEPNCFVCRKAVSKKGSTIRQICSLQRCGKYYHPECLKMWPQTQWSIISTTKHRESNKNLDTFVCPSHVCHTCASDDPRAANSRCPSDKLAKCLRCPASYHCATYCIPAGTEILSTNQIICPRHYGEDIEGNLRKPMHVINTLWCFICSEGGDLICCETCPTSVHSNCLPVNLTEDNTFICEDCESGRFPLYDEIVWVKLGSYRWWPAIVLFPNEVPDNVSNLKHSQGEFVVKFFGTFDHYWVSRGRVFLFQEGDQGHSHSNKNKIDAAFLKAIEEAAAAHELKKEFKLAREAEKNNSLKPPPYIKIKVNKPVGNVRQVDFNVSNTTPCDCDPSQPHPCGPESDCLNRLLMTECNPQVCPAGDRCNNQCFEKREYPPMVPYKTEGRGWGLKTLAPIRKGQFVIEYVGEIIDEQEYQRRIKKMHEQKEENYYFLTIDKDRMLDAGPKGNAARFMNHCCQPNCDTQKWTVNGDTRVGLFANQDIPAGSELTFNYNLECVGKEMKVCRCGAPNCSGFIGVKAKTTDEAQRKPRKSVTKSKKKKDMSAEEEGTKNPCFVCGKTGKVGACNNKVCMKYYHLECVNLSIWPEGNKWVCPWHSCNICTKRTIRCCVKCINSYCPTHSEGNIRYDNLLGFICRQHDPSIGDAEEIVEIPVKSSRVRTKECTVSSSTHDEVDNLSSASTPKRSRRRTSERRFVNGLVTSSTPVSEIQGDITVSSATEDEDSAPVATGKRARPRRSEIENKRPKLS